MSPALAPYIPDDVFNIIFEYGSMWIIKFRLLNKQIKSKADERMKQVYIDTAVDTSFKIIRSGIDFFPIVLSYFIIHTVSILKKTPIKKVTIRDKIHLYTIAFHIWGRYNYKLRFYDSLPKLLKRTFELCKTQENYKHYVNAFYSAVLQGVQFEFWKVKPLTVKELLIKYEK